jgi:hypothetical protein
MNNKYVAVVLIVALAVTDIGHASHRAAPPDARRREAHCGEILCDRREKAQRASIWAIG